MPRSICSPALSYQVTVSHTIDTRVKSGKFGRQVNFGHTFANSVNPDETAPYEPSHQDFHCLLS